jgi:GAF domain-containing protein
MEIRSAPLLLTPASIAAARPALQRMVRSSLPRLADFCLVFVALPSTIVCAAAGHVTADGTRAALALMRTYRVRRTDPGSTVASVIRTARPALRKAIHPDPAPSARDLVSVLHRRLAPRSALAVPILARDTVLGALTVCYSHSGRSYDTRDIAAVARLASRVGRVLTSALVTDAELRLRSATGDARQGTTIRRRVAARN